MKKIFFLILIIIFLTTTSLAQAKNDDKKYLPILMYHYIRDYNDKKDPLGINLSVSLDNFAKQLDEINNLGYKTINFQDIKNNKLPDKPIILTFDDGYEDFYTNALPELKKRSMKAVVYIIAGAIDTEHYMTTEQIKKLADDNIEVGDHTWTHPDLRHISNEKISWELADSKKYLESIIKKPIISLAYPSGKYNDYTLKKAQETGYMFAVTTKNGLANMAKVLTLSRLRMENNTDFRGLVEKPHKPLHKNDLLWYNSTR